jgi:soluble lytic murein transglycosylase-like protein
MHVASGRSVAKLCKLTVVGLFGILVMSGAAVPAPGGELDRAATADSAAADTLPAPPLVLDSARAEYLGRYNDDRLLVRRISRAVLRESRRQQVPPSLIAGVLLTENTTLRPEAESSVGAQGLMQVMPFHAGARLCNSDDLVDVDSNICHGTLILARNLRATSTSTAALLRYNGCVRGTNTPDCRRYPDLVLARAGRVRQEMLAGVMAPVQLAQK